MLKFDINYNGGHSNKLYINQAEKKLFTLVLCMVRRFLCLSVHSNNYKLQEVPIVRKR